MNEYRELGCYFDFISLSVSRTMLNHHHHHQHQDYRHNINIIILNLSIDRSDAAVATIYDTLSGSLGL